MAGNVLVDDGGNPLVDADGKVPLSDLLMPSVIRYGQGYLYLYQRGSSTNYLRNAGSTIEAPELISPIWDANWIRLNDPDLFEDSAPMQLESWYSRYTWYSYPNWWVYWPNLWQGIHFIWPMWAGTSLATGLSFELPYKRMKTVELDWEVVYKDGPASDAVFNFYYFSHYGPPSFTAPTGKAYRPFVTDPGWESMASVTIPSGATAGDVLASGTIRYLSYGVPWGTAIGYDITDPTTPANINAAVTLKLGNTTNHFGRVDYHLV